MVKEDQTAKLSSNDDNNLVTKQIEDAKASEDIEMTNGQDALPTSLSSIQFEEPSVDAVMGLRVTLEDLRQQIARAVVAGATQEDLLKLQERAVNIQNCIKFLDEAQAFCIPPLPSVNDAALTVGQKTAPTQLSFSEIPV
ncbi:hypothetical protein G6F46_013166 [Rhizopus delemar]|uniref:Uncharacterized protein n=2 Tax=Rhizopus TaxID=4842 RepID=I1CUS9_RHIO9|nr:hypothetical protein RO3G_17016 [Rhizopus delemar RA 99-880]KAG1440704.1 hypothetical protein G6F55_013426 [Rhizopus delemar]KAG1530680.1 hypothetical protein G6F51_013764 [Rhizopus arrhizus]KAG1485074.1 hypothetical protein G6F54_013388 [Rhizopus delemar]KAG1489973.1 hypothetical protein G6F53_013328 [Rhizopus delemar]|eukprot:EIE92209.1 hypothetical protein RO3G_17016 [Rhizopus delemar RA 99-880]